MKKNIFLVMRIVILLGCITYLVLTIDFKTLINDVLSKLPIWVLFVSISLTLLSLWLNGIRWRIANTDNTNRISNWDYFKYMMISASFNLVMPGSVGGDLVKALWVGSDLKSEKTRNILSIFFDRAIGMFSIIFLGAIAFLFSPFFDLWSKLIGLTAIALFFLVMFFIVWLLKKDKLKKRVECWETSKVFLKKIKNVLLVFQDIISIYLKKPGIIFAMLGISLVMHASYFLMSYLIAIFLGIDIAFLDISAVSCLVWLITAIPISISGIGVREISYITILGYYDIGNELATGLSLYIFLVKVITGIIGLPFVLVSKRRKRL